MDQERENYEDLDPPPARFWTRDRVVGLLLLVMVLPWAVPLVWLVWWMIVYSPRIN